MVVYKPQDGDIFHLSRRMIDSKIKVGDNLYYTGLNGCLSTDSNGDACGKIIEIPSFRFRLSMAIKNFIKEMKNPAIKIVFNSNKN